MLSENMKKLFVEWEVREGQIGVSKTIKFAILRTVISIQRMVILNQTYLQVCYLT